MNGIGNPYGMNPYAGLLHETLRRVQQFDPSGRPFEGLGANMPAGSQPTARFGRPMGRPYDMRFGGMNAGYQNRVLPSRVQGY